MPSSWTIRIIRVLLEWHVFNESSPAGHTGDVSAVTRSSDM
ncbi:hypothetical protein [Collibacillus ludicampi]|nr:hypothetical protein [Collibacillus ludicampi]